jgi:hypothetical protein
MQAQGSSKQHLTILLRTGTYSPQGGFIEGLTVIGLCIYVKGRAGFDAHKTGNRHGLRLELELWKMIVPCAITVLTLPTLYCIARTMQYCGIGKWLA